MGPGGVARRARRATGGGQRLRLELELDELLELELLELLDELLLELLEELFEELFELELDELFEDEFEELFELELDELFEERLELELAELLELRLPELLTLELDERRVSPSAPLPRPLRLFSRPTARAALFRPRSQALKKPCTGVSARGSARRLSSPSSACSGATLSAPTMAAVTMALCFVFMLYPLRGVSDGGDARRGCRRRAPRGHRWCCGAAAAVSLWNGLDGRIFPRRV